jgi:hypothetical protein
MNRDQKFAFQIALKTIQTFIENPTNYEPLWMIASGTAGLLSQLIPRSEAQ